MNKKNKLLDEDINKRFTQESKYQSKWTPKTKKNIREIIIGLIIFLILILNFIFKLSGVFFNQ